MRLPAHSPLMGGEMFTVECFEGTKHHLFPLVEALRSTCWRSALDDLRSLDDGHDDHSLHWAVTSGTDVVAAARMCKHNEIESVPDPHLWLNPPHTGVLLPVACINRLVVHPNFRGCGIGIALDQARAAEAVALECRTILGAWNVNSGEKRLKQLESQGFVSVNGNQPVPDGDFGFSYPYAKSISLVKVAHAEV